MVRFASSALGIGLALVVVAGCGPGPGIADRIRAANSDLVKVVEFSSSLTGPGEVDVRLIPGATVAQAHQLWCDIVVPAGGRDLDRFPVVVWSTDPLRAGVNPVLADRRVTCPPAG